MRLVQTTGRYFYDFSKWLAIDSTVYGSSSPTVALQSDGVTLNGNSSDCRLLINDMIPLRNATINLELTVSTASQIGFTYRDGVLSSKNGSSAYILYITATSIILAEGNNSDSARTPYVLKTISGTYTGRHILSVNITDTTHKIYLDGVLLTTYTNSDFTNYGYITIRAFNNMVNERFHSLEVLSAEIKDPTIFDIARRVALVFDKDVNSSNLLSNLQAFTITSVSKQFTISGETITKQSHPTDIMYALDGSGQPIKNILILTIDKPNAFRVPISIQVQYNAVLGNLYGARTIDVMPNFNYNTRVVATNLQAPGFDVYDASMQFNQASLGADINSRMITYVNNYPSETLAFLGTRTGGVVITLNGVIKP